MNAKYFKLKPLDQEILALAEKGYNSSQIATRLFNPYSFPRFVRRRISALKKEGKIRR